MPASPAAPQTERSPEARPRPVRRDGSRLAGPLRPTISFGRIAGIEIGANWTWLIVVALILWSLAAAVFPTQNPGLSDLAYGAMGVVAAFLFFASLLLHELGHALQARREGMEIDGITLWVFGGVAWFRGMFPSAGAELRIAVAGPAVTAVIAAVLLTFTALVSLPAEVDGVLTWVGRINAILLAFNLLPALPLDGGRVLRAILWRLTADFVRATRIAGALGTALGQILIVGGFVLLFAVGAAGGLWFALLGWILMGAAGAETSYAVARQALSGLQVADAMTPRPAVADARTPLAEFMRGLFRAQRHATYPVLADGRPAGLLAFRSAARVPAADWERVRVADVAVPLSEVVVLEEDSPLEDALMDLRASPEERALVVRDGALTGIVSATDVARLIELCRVGRPLKGP